GPQPGPPDAQCARHQRPHARIERRAAQVAGHRDPVVAVDHVVVVVDLVNVDRRQLVAFDHRLVDAGPALPHPPVDRQEAGVEIGGLGVGRHRADDAVDRDLLDSAEGAALETRRPEYRLDGAQTLGAAGEDRAERTPKRPRARSIEVLDGADALYAQSTAA